MDSKLLYVNSFHNIATVSLGNYKPYDGLDYSIRGGQKGASNILSVSVITGDKEWKKITVSYLVTSRSDFFAGTFYTDLYSVYGCGSEGPNFLEVSHNVGKIANYHPGYKVQVFVAGVSTQDSSFDLEISGVHYDSATGILRLAIENDAEPFISDLHLSYIIYDAQALPSRNFESDDYQFSFTSSFASSSAGVSSISFDTIRLNCVGSGCIDYCTTREECKKKGGNISDNDCIVCGPYEKIENKRCVPNCKANEIFANGVCECAPGYMKFIGECVFRCGINEIWKND